MAAIVKANSSLAAGGLAVLRRSFATSDDGTMTYSADYCCLAIHANKWTRSFKTRSQPPTPLPREVLQLQLTKTPELFALETHTLNGITYFAASYSAGVASEVIITEESDVRLFNLTTITDVGYYITVPGTIDGATTFVKTGQVVDTNPIEYVSITVTATSKNATLPNVKGRATSIDGKELKRFSFLGGAFIDQISLIERTSKSRSSRGEYTYSKSSSGIIKDLTRNSLIPIT